MTFIIDYATTSPAIVEAVLLSVCGNAIPMWHDLYDCFEVNICWWDEDSVTDADIERIREVMAPFIQEPPLDKYRQI